MMKGATTCYGLHFETSRTHGGLDGGISYYCIGTLLYPQIDTPKAITPVI